MEFFYRTSPEIAVRLDNYVIMGKDNDTVPRTHPFAARDMSYIKNMNLVEYELYDLDKDISQSDNIIDNFQNAESYIRLVNIKLAEIQTHGYYWEELPAMEESRRIIKTKFNPY